MTRLERIRRARLGVSELTPGDDAHLLGVLVRHRGLPAHASQRARRRAAHQLVRRQLGGESAPCLNAQPVAHHLRGGHRPTAAAVAWSRPPPMRPAHSGQRSRASNASGKPHADGVNGREGCGPPMSPSMKPPSGPERAPNVTANRPSADSRRSRSAARNAGACRRRRPRPASRPDGSRSRTWSTRRLGARRRDGRRPCASGRRDWRTPIRWARGRSTFVRNASLGGRRTRGERGGLLALAEVGELVRARPARVKKSLPYRTRKATVATANTTAFARLKRPAPAREGAPDVGSRGLPPWASRRRRIRSARGGSRGAEIANSRSARSTAERTGTRETYSARPVRLRSRASPLERGAGVLCVRARLASMTMSSTESAGGRVSLWANSQHIDIGVLQCRQNEGVSSTKRKAAFCPPVGSSDSPVRFHRFHDENKHARF